MRLLLDESVPRRLRRALPSQVVKTVAEMGWVGLKNGELLSLAAPAFDAFLTVDKNLPHQQNLASLPLSVVILNAHSNELDVLLPLIPQLEEVLSKLQPRVVVQVGT